MCVANSGERHQQRAGARQVTRAEHVWDSLAGSTRKRTTQRRPTRPTARPTGKPARTSDETRKPKMVQGRTELYNNHPLPTREKNPATIEKTTKTTKRRISTLRLLLCNALAHPCKSHLRRGTSLIYRQDFTRAEARSFHLPVSLLTSSFARSAAHSCSVLRHSTPLGGLLLGAAAQNASPVMATL